MNLRNGHVRATEHSNPHFFYTLRVSGASEQPRGGPCCGRYGLHTWNTLAPGSGTQMLDGLSCPLGTGSGCHQEARSGLSPGQLPFPELRGRQGCITLLSKSGFLPTQMSPRDPQSRVWPPHPASRTPQKSSCSQNNGGAGGTWTGRPLLPPPVQS